PHLAGFPVALPRGLGARHDPAGAVHGGVHRVALKCLGWGAGRRRAAHDDGVVPHRTADEPLLPWKRRRRALAHHDDRLSAVLLAPGEVMVVVDELLLAAAEDRYDLARDPLAAGIRVLAGQRHERPVVLPHRQ